MMKRHMAVILSGVIFIAAAAAAVTAAYACIAKENVSQLEFKAYEHICDHSSYTDTYDAADTAKQGVVRVLADGDEKALSTAFAVGKCGEKAQFFLTNYHSVKNGKAYIYTCHMANAVIKDGRIFYDYNITEEDLENNRYSAEVLAFDEKHDIALLKTDKPAENVVPLKILDSSKEFIQGEQVYILSFPASNDRLSSGDGFKKAVYADKESITVIEGETAYIFENEEDSIHLKADLSEGCSGSPVILKNGTVLGMVKQANFSVIIDPVREAEIYEPAGNGTAVKVDDIKAFLEANGVYFEKGIPFAQAGCTCTITETADESGEKSKTELFRLLKNVEILSTLLFGALNVIGCGIFLSENKE